MSQPSSRTPAEHAVGVWLFRARWLLLPIFAGLVVALAGLVVVFVVELVHEGDRLIHGEAKHAVLAVLSLIDLSLAGNLLVIVIFSGYENFITRIRTAESVERPSWMGQVDFSGMKLKLMGSIVAISAIASLRAFVAMVDEGGGPDNRTMAWLVGGNLAFVVSGVLLALMDYIASKTEKH